jgi:uncharacterized protein (TIGR03435 family)
MANQFAEKLGFAKKLVLAAVALSAVAVPMVAGLVNQAGESAQAEKTPPASFEAASVKPAPLAGPVSCSGGPGTSDPGLWTCSNVPLAFLISNAYGFQAYQFPPHAPCCQARVDINARVPKGASKEQFQLMLQNLLVERFEFAFHYKQNEMAIYELGVDEKGLKLKRSAVGAHAPEQDPWTPPKFTMGRDGYPVFAPGEAGLQGLGGHYRWVGFNLSTQEIAKTLAFQLGRPVVDATGLQDKYDVDMTWAIDAAWLLESSGRADLAAEMPDAGPSGPSLMRAVQDQLGLKLISKKGLGEIVVVDRVESVPTAN